MDKKVRGRIVLPVFLKSLLIIISGWMCVRQLTWTSGLRGDRRAEVAGGGGLRGVMRLFAGARRCPQWCPSSHRTRVSDYSKTTRPRRKWFATHPHELSTRLLAHCRTNTRLFALAYSQLSLHLDNPHRPAQRYPTWNFRFKPGKCLTIQ